MQLCEEHAADADGTGPDDENAVAFARIGATHRVGADREELDHRRLIERDAVGRGHIALRHTDVVGHSSINMNAEDGDALTAIGLAAPAGDAGAAGEIGDDKDPLTDRDGAARPGLLHFAGQFVSDNSRIFEKGMRAFVDVQIRAAHPGATNPHEHFAGTRRGSRPLDHRQFSRLHAKQRSQSPSSLFVFLFVMDKKRLAGQVVFSRNGASHKKTGLHRGEVRESNTVFKRAYNRGLTRLRDYPIASDIGSEPSWSSMAEAVAATWNVLRSSLPTPDALCRRV